MGAFLTSDGIRTPPPDNYNSTDIRVITLDGLADERGWFETRPDIVILKVDVEGLDYAVIQGAQKLLNARIVRNIFMEITAATKEQGALQKPALEMLINAGYKLFQRGGYRGPNQPALSLAHDDTLADIIVHEAESKGGTKQLNLWWTIDSFFLESRNNATAPKLSS